MRTGKALGEGAHRRLRSAPFLAPLRSASPSHFRELSSWSNAVYAQSFSLAGVFTEPFVQRLKRFSGAPLPERRCEVPSRKALCSTIVKCLRVAPSLAKECRECALRRYYRIREKASQRGCWKTFQNGVPRRCPAKTRTATVRRVGAVCEGVSRRLSTQALWKGTEASCQGALGAPQRRSGTKHRHCLWGGARKGALATRLTKALPDWALKRVLQEKASPLRAGTPRRCFAPRREPEKALQNSANTAEQKNERAVNREPD